jgi:hypothetical protein
MRWLLIVLICVISACTSPPSQRREQNFPDIRPQKKVKKLSEVQADGRTPGKAFWGLEPGYCIHPILGKGVYVIGFWQYNGKSPVKSAGLLAGDKLICINGHCDDFTTKDLSDYLFVLSPIAANEIDIQRVENSKITRKKIEFASMKLPDSCISETTGVAWCPKSFGRVGCPN